MKDLGAVDLVAIGGAKSVADIGKNFGGTLYACRIKYLRARECVSEYLND